MKTAFLTFEQYHGKRDIGSSRIRARWIVEKWNEAGPDIGTAEIYQFGKAYDAMIFQKVYWPKYAKEFKGIKILDLCDQDWGDWNCSMVEMIEECDAVTCSTLEIAKFIVNITDKPVMVIPDRVNFDKISTRKLHEGPAKKVVWYGYIENQLMLDSAIPAIVKAKLDLIVIANKPYTLPHGFDGKLQVKNYPWNEATVNADLCKADIIINPRHTSGRWRYKSNNKTVLGWALGIPVAHTEQELLALLEEAPRKAEADKRYEEAKENYNVLSSVEEWKDLILEIQKGKGI